MEYFKPPTLHHPNKLYLQTCELFRKSCAVRVFSEKRWFSTMNLYLNTNRLQICAINVWILSSRKHCFLLRLRSQVYCFVNRNMASCANKLGKSFVFLFFLRNSVFCVVMFLWVQYSLKSFMLRKWRLGVWYHWWGRDGVTGTFPLKNIWNLAE